MADNMTPEERAARVLAKSPEAQKKQEEKKKQEEDPFYTEANPHSHVKHMIGIVSGKGGVGKSSVTAMLANYLVAEGFKVGILDADITGPSIPKMYGVHGPTTGTEDGAYPVEAENGVKIMSINLMLDSEEEPVVWRGPVIAGAVKQFWTDVMWGDIDYLLVDMPPGTGDVPLTVYQSLPINGIVIVTSPQDLVRMIVTKAVNMANMMHVPVLGIVENYSYLEVAKDLQLAVLGKLPLNPEFAEKADAGRVFDMKSEDLQRAASVLKALK